MKIQIIRECSGFLRESCGEALIKYLPIDSPDSLKVKLRKQRTSTDFDKLFNLVFMDHPDLRQRCVFSNGVTGARHMNNNSDLEAFYIFPIDGYKFIYSPNVDESRIQYGEMLLNIVDAMGDETKAFKTFVDVLNYDYTSEDLATGISSGCEIILYGFTHFYAIRASSVKRYSSLFSL